MGASDLILPDDVLGDFFPPSSTDMVDGLVAEYRRDRQRIADASNADLSPEFRSVWGYFATGNATDERNHTSLAKSVEQMFEQDGAVCALNAAYWSRALSLTDVYDAMPQARRTQWDEQIRNPRGCASSPYSGAKDIPRLPDFEEETVRSTIMELLKSGGILVAVLPASARNRDLLPGWGLEWSRVYDNEFAGTSVSVVLLKARKP